MEMSDQFTIRDLGPRGVDSQPGCVFMWGDVQSMEDRGVEPEMLRGPVKLTGLQEKTLVIEVSEDAFINIGHVVEGQREHLREA